ncbi:shikimate O-hydroxycinnamoyltransferase-like [Brassica rapa]|nr:shikimate O-hydroxycinnamoyltransferase-like [Brassica rapa]
MCPDSEATVSMVVKIHFLVGPISDILLLCLPPQTSFLFVLLSFPKTELVTKVVKTFRPFFFSLLQILFLDQLRFMSHMKIRVKQASIVKPAEETPIHSLWLSNLDLIQVRFHMGILYFYNPCSSSSLPNTPSLIDALRKVLVLFYPAAGRLQKDKNGRLEVLCNGEGVLLVEAETDSTIQDVGLLTQALDLSELVPTLAYSGDISSLPLLLFQVTYFKCGAICIGTLIHHTFGDAGSLTCFMEAWSRTARGLPVTPTPFFDRTILRARDPPSPVFPHTEYQPPPFYNPPVTSLAYKSNPDSDSGVVSLKLTRLQLRALRAKTEVANHKSISTYELLVAHIWRCACFANEDSREEHLTRLHIILDGRSRLEPKLPQGYIGNALFHARPISLLGDLLREPFSRTVERVHGEIRKMDNEYLRSAIDCLERHPDLDQLVPGEGNPIFSCAANFCIVSLRKDTSAYELDFGWGKPFFKRTSHLNEGKGFVGMSLDEEGSFIVFMCLKKTQLSKFRKLFYEFLNVSAL